MRVPLVCYVFDSHFEKDRQPDDLKMTRGGKSIEALVQNFGDLFSVDNDPDWLSVAWRNVGAHSFGLTYSAYNVAVSKLNCNSRLFD